MSYHTTARRATVTQDALHVEAIALGDALDFKLEDLPPADWSYPVALDGDTCLWAETARGTRRQRQLCRLADELLAKHSQELPF